MAEEIVVLERCNDEEQSANRGHNSGHDVPLPTTGLTTHLVRC